MGAEDIKIMLEKIDARLETQQTICLIGPTALILMGHTERNTEHIDIWADASHFVDAEMREAAEAAGLLYDPINEIPHLPYIQVVYPGIVQVPGYDSSNGSWFDSPPLTLWTGEYLTVQCPPPAVIVASKMRRFNDRDVTDSIWLISHNELAADSIMEAVRQLTDAYREDAEENLVVLTAIM